MAASSVSTPEVTRPKRSHDRAVARVFAFPVMCMFLLGAVIFGFCVKQFAEPDIWWHLRYAHELFQTHTFPAMDTFTFTEPGAFRPNFEWLSEVAYYGAFRAADLRGIFAVYFSVLLLIYAGVYYRSCKEGDCKNATVATLIGVFLGVVSIGPRTLLFGWLCMVGLLLVLDHFRRTGRGAWMLPPLFLLWVNLHGSWLFGMVVAVIVAASGFVEGEWGLVEARRWSARERWRLPLAIAASVPLLFVNPFGYKVVLYPFDLMFHQQSAVQYVQEWQSVDFSSPNGKFALLVVLGLLAAAIFSRRRWRLDEVLLTAFAVWAALSHARFLFFAGIVLPPVLASRISLFPPYAPEIDKPYLNSVIMAAIVAAVVAFFPSRATLQRQVEEQYPKAALEFMQRQNMHGRIFNQYLWGGYMEWFTPELKPFIDGRADIFVYNRVLDDHRRTTGVESPLEVLDKYQIDYALLQPDRPLTYVLQHSPAWREAYSDKVALVFQRAPAAAPSSVQ